jgi:hypothetical protein
MSTITPKDKTEQTATDASKRIATVLAVLATAATATCTALGGLGWIADNVPLLATGLGSLATGGIASYIAIRRMLIDRAAK